MNIQSVDCRIGGEVWQVVINGKAWLEFQSQDAAIRAVQQIRGYTSLTGELEDFPDEWEDDEPLTHYCDKCDEECEPDGVWNGIFLFYCHSCGTQYEVIP